MHLLRLILKNLGRNKLRSTLTSLAVIALVAIFSMIATVMKFLDDLVVQKSKDVRVVITERHRAFSLFDRRHYDDIVLSGSPLNDELRKIPGFQPDSHTIWHFAAFTVDPAMKDPNLGFFAIATLPEKIGTMTEGLDEFDPRLVDLVVYPPKSRLQNAGLVVGETRLEKIGKKVGDVFKVKSTTHRHGDALGLPIEFQFEIVGALPRGSRWSEVAFMDFTYLDRAMKAYKNAFDGKVTHAWLQFDTEASAQKAGTIIEQKIPDIKCETAATVYSRALEPLKGIMRAIKFGLVPAILVVMTVILANTFSLSVRERQAEMAVLKILGFSPGQILILVLGEGVLVGFLAGLTSAGLTYFLVNILQGGIHLTAFPRMFIPWQVLWWGPLIGGGTAFLGGLIPALGARAVRPSEVFASVS